jgi:hypothetical protein
MFTDSKTHKLSQLEIIKTALEKQGSPYNMQQSIAAVTAEAYAPNTIVMREGNTLFFINYDPQDKSRGMFRALNADTPQNYLNNSVEFIRAAGMAGFKTLISQFSDPSLVHIFKYVSRHAPFPGMGYAVQHDNEKHIYQVTVNLGEAGPTTKGAI